MNRLGSAAADISVATSEWTEAFLSVCAKFVPCRQARRMASSKPWFSQYLKRLAKLRDRLFRRSHGKHKSPKAIAAFRAVRNLFVAEFRSAESRYLMDLGYQLTGGHLSPQ